ncbi:MAG: hypothetical protein M3P16_01285 [Chloroflexota bacterium]|nr:hypothetical protein [Chloroflexota bacterium]
MTVHASHVALLDLVEHGCPPAAVREATDIADLIRRYAMVELENNDVRFAAIHARVRSQVLIELPAILLTTQLDLRDRSPDVVGLVLQIVRATERCVTGAAMTLQGASFLVPEREGLR